MARPKSEDRRNAIIASTIRLVAEQGTGAPTAEVAKAAGVPHGSVFTYFATKADLLNTVYAELKAELTGEVVRSMPKDGPLVDRLRESWTAWTSWGAAHPVEMKALAQLSVSELVNETNRQAAYEAAGPVIDVIASIAEKGALTDAPGKYIGSLVEALATTTMDAMAADPQHASEIQKMGFEAVHNMLR